MKELVDYDEILFYIFWIIDYDRNLNMGSHSSKEDYNITKLKLLRNT